MLKSLEIHGFKSFAKKAELSFNTPIASIVGPNGSGKSNVAEAFRFVLGEQSVKSMRGKRGEDLIFNGSHEVPRMSRAYVRIVFDNGRRFLDIDFDEVTIERVVHRDGTNEYKINGSTVRLKDISELLSKANIGSSGHHIISQGEADRILSANSKDRKEMIEDALGLRTYHYKIQESERKLTKTRENIKEAQLLRREIAPHLRFLQKQVEKVKKAKELREGLLEKYHEYLQREAVYLSEEKTYLDEHMPEPQRKLEELQNALAEARRVLEERHTTEERSDEVEALERQLSEHRSQQAEYVRELGKVEGEIAAHERMRDRREHTEVEHTVPFDEVQTFADEISVSITHLVRVRDTRTIHSALGVLHNTVSEFLLRFKKNDRAEHGQSAEDAQQEIDSLYGKKTELEEQIAEAKKLESQTQEAYTTLQRDIADTKDSERSAETAVFRLRAEKNEVESELTRLQGREATYKKARAAFEQELQEGAVLVGQGIMQYKQFAIPEQDSFESHESVRDAQEGRRRDIERMKIQLEEMGGGSSDEVLKEFTDVSERDEHLARELTDLEQTASSLEQIIVDLEERLEKEFNDGIGKINTEFQRYFSLMFGGGTASLAVRKATKSAEDDEDSEEQMQNRDEGIDIAVSLPRKKVHSLVMLSGGERALTSIALLFAMSQVTPPPFIILDETDAALDEANSRKYGDMIEKLSEKSQLILITHNRETMSRAGVLYGVTMGSGGVSKLLSVAFDEAVVVAK